MWGILAAMGGIEPYHGDPAPDRESYILGTSLLGIAILGAPASTLATVVLWTNAPVPGKGKSLSIVSMFLVSSFWWLAFGMVVAAMVASGHPLLIAILTPIGVALALLGAICTQTSRAIVAVRSSPS